MRGKASALRELCHEVELVAGEVGYQGSYDWDRHLFRLHATGHTVRQQQRRQRADVWIPLVLRFRKLGLHFRPVFSEGDGSVRLVLDLHDPEAVGEWYRRQEAEQVLRALRR